MHKLTPMMKQYMNIKNNHKDCIIFFRLGDFYEMFFEDAILASKLLEITLTGRECGKKEKAPMCGVPYHSANSYISKLVNQGYKVAICEQVEDPSKAKGIVKRDVVRIITPGTITDTNVLDEKTNNYLCSIFIDYNGCGISYVDITTGELYTTQIHGNINKSTQVLINELAKINPTEIIVNKLFFDIQNLEKKIKARFNCIINDKSYELNIKDARKIIKKQLNIITLEGYGIEKKVFSILSTGYLIEYLNTTQKITLNHLNNLTSYSINNFMSMDISTRKNLELTKTIRNNKKIGSLLWVLDNTSTAMGARLLNKWIEQPLIEVHEINRRLNVVEYLFNNLILMDDIKELLKPVYDIERLVGRIGCGNCNARDLISLKSSLQHLPTLKNKLLSTDCYELTDLGNNLDALEDIYNLIQKSIIDDPPLTIKEGGIIKRGYKEELDELTQITINGKNWIANLQQNERNRTGIKSLKVGFNKIFGYYIEVTKTNLKLVPDNYLRKQTLSNSERYVTPELKDMEAKILGAEEKSMNLEYEIFTKVRKSIKNEIKRIQKCAKIIAEIDAINSLSIAAYKNNYIRPSINNNGEILIKNGRHPVVEKMLDNELFVPNNILLDNKNNRFVIITGPNMAGKSTFMRQVALIVLMAQIGSFVPADNADIGIVDKIFTRIGASDDLSQGQSTFMVEMSEVANILNNGTQNSLLILDEIGRGTSTLDGLSIAWAVIEYITNQNKLGAKTLFATHYHELTQLENKIEGVKNYKILVKEEGKDIVFLRKISRGGADKSYGIEVARLAGIPQEVINRANTILDTLEGKSIKTNKISVTNTTKPHSRQLDIFNLKDNEIIKKLKTINIMKTTPIEAINILNDLVEKVNNTQEK